MAILIIGRTGAGKDTYATELEKLGVKGLKSYTTRAKRSPDEDSHIFVSWEEAEAIEDKIAETKIQNGGEVPDWYFATKQQYEEAGYYIIDPYGFATLLTSELLRGEKFGVVYISADRHIRKARATSRGNKLREVPIFERRDSDESPQFSLFENWSFGEDVCLIKHHNNSNDLSILSEWAKSDLELFAREGIKF